MLQRLKTFAQQLTAALKLLQKNDPLRLAGATAFFANFALPPIMLMLIQLFGFFLGDSVIANRLFDRLETLLGKNGSSQIQQVLGNITATKTQLWATILSFIFFLFVATTCFSIIKNSLDQIWKIRLNDKPGMIMKLKVRLRSIIVILIAGILFLIGFITDSIQGIIGTYLKHNAPSYGMQLLDILDEIGFIIIMTIWFSVLFRFLTNGRPSWLISFKGGLLTGILFTLGKHILRILLPMSNIGNIYGASGSIILVMLFVFYSALIFYFGACFVKIISADSHTQIRPIKGAFEYELKAVNKNPKN